MLTPGHLSDPASQKTGALPVFKGVFFDRAKDIAVAPARDFISFIEWLAFDPGDDGFTLRFPQVVKLRPDLA
jgi:hypothetical protein